jgi:hypothetical protein
MEKSSVPIREGYRLIQQNSGGLRGTLQQVVENSFPALLIVFVSNWDLSLTIMTLIPIIKPNGWMETKFIWGFCADAKVR